MAATSRVRSVYRCGACDHQAPRWLGRCPECGGWGTLEEEAAPGRSGPALGIVAPAPVRLADLAGTEPERMRTGLEELDRVLGGGIVPGSLVLLGGEPGIGKSTLVLQALAGLARERRVILVTGEESGAQVSRRAARLGGCDEVEVLAETRLEAVLAALEAHRPAVCAIDSVQTLASDALDGAAGSVAQVRQAAGELMRVAKTRDISLILIGQVTKDGSLAGPRLLEHLVDCVLSFEGDDARAHRVLRASKNRFGSTNETGLFEMRPAGLAPVADPSALYLAEAGERRVGSCRFPAIEGSRALLVEVQALVGPTEIVPPRRLAGGIDRTRLSQIVAVLGRHAGLRLGDQDIFVSVAGGARALDPAADLAIALAIASAHRGVPLAGGTVAFGELGLTGGVRPVGHLARRLGAAAAQGMTRAVVPQGASAEPVHQRPDAVIGVAAIPDALEAAF